MNKREYIAYAGTCFTVEWYYNAKTRSAALEYYENLSMNEKISILRLFKRIGDVGELQDKTKFNYEGDQIYAFKPQAERFLCFFTYGKKIVVTHAFRKKQQKLPKKEKNIALQRFSKI
jgi:phage-related protein